ncbi:MAG: Sec-independent protein translocase subunit TatA [Jatrophihabitantaceae bacterium]
MGWQSPSHWVIIALAVLVLFGYKKLPEMSRSVGRSLRIFKTEIKGMSEDDAARDSAATTPAAAPAASEQVIAQPVVAPPPVTPSAVAPVTPVALPPAAEDESRETPQQRTQA